MVDARMHDVVLLAGDGSFMVLVHDGAERDHMDLDFVGLMDHSMMDLFMWLM